MSGGLGIAGSGVLTAENEDSIENTLNFPKIQVFLTAHNFAKYESLSMLFYAACANEHGASFKLLHVPRASEYVISQHCEQARV